MNEKALKILEYNKIIEMLVSYASCNMAKESLEKLQPGTDLDEIKDSLRSTSEGVGLIVRKGPLPLGNLYDIHQSLGFAAKGGSLNMGQLMHVGYNMRVASQVKNFLNNDDFDIDFPIIKAYLEVIEEMPKLSERIEKSIISEDEMSDNASGELRSIRREMARQNDEIKAKLNKIISSGDKKSVLRDSLVTMRDGRYVIPVKQEQRSNFPGIIHDQSSSGATLFIEPQVIVDLNNRLRELELEEQAEIARILKELSERVAEYHKQLDNNQKLLTELDIIMAKAKLSLAMDGEEAEIYEDGELVLNTARHPLIDKKTVVPIDISVGGDYRTLVITGPNTGGKTVSLKTVGLLCLMAQSGLHIPAASTSKLPIFEKIFADIGDEQSIEQSLSTFSSHMKTIVKITRYANEKSLILVDELGAGTDPTEGAALAISILENFYEKGAYTLATTHYNELKKYAISTEGIENASMEFDVESLSPTYRLIVGLAGKSNAFEISKKLGLDKKIIENSKTRIETGDMEFEDVLSSIEQDKHEAEKALAEANVIKAEMERMEQEFLKKQKRLERDEKKILDEARDKAKSIIQDAEETSKEVKEELKNLAMRDSLGERTKGFDESRKKLKEAKQKYSEGLQEEAIEGEAVNEDTLQIGDRVRLIDMNQIGEVISLADSKGRLSVKLGLMKVNTQIDNLLMVESGAKAKALKEAKKQASKATYGKLYKDKTMHFSTSINVQGENLEDALAKVDKYLDDAFISNVHEVTIIHGRGEGILKSGIRAMLKKNKHVASFRAGEISEGGDGVTVVKFK
ncbi:MAG: endonuclease MutS2 [Clostridia bacterium]|nr:endonuclease MutS2 [Clostridia bacterium]